MAGEPRGHVCAGTRAAARRCLPLLAAARLRVPAGVRARALPGPDLDPCSSFRSSPARAFAPAPGLRRAPQSPRTSCQSPSQCPQA